MKILYCVQGDGKGHALRSAVVIEWLKKTGHEVMIAASNDAHAIMEKKFGGAFKIEGARLSYSQDSLLVGKTLLNFFLGFPARDIKNFFIYKKIFKSFKPRFVISDMEPDAFYFSKFFHTPVISIDNNSFVARYEDIEIPENSRLMFWGTKLMFSAWNPNADYYIITTFINAESRSPKIIFVPPILRQQILNYKPRDNGHILVYQTSSKSKSFLDILKKFDKNFIIYGFNVEKKDENLTFKRFNEDVFFDDFGCASGVITNGGYTLISEAVYLHKPLLSVPIKKQLEQVYSSLYIDKLGYGSYQKNFTYEGIKNFLNNLSAYGKNIENYAQTGNEVLFEILENILKKYET